MSQVIAKNRKAHFEYQIEERLEAGLVLEGWEVKSLRFGKGQITDTYVLLKKGEAFLLGATITPLSTATSHIYPDPTRTRKLLLHRRELDRLIGLVERKGYSLIPLELHWGKNGRSIKVTMAVAKGKKQHDKRATIKEREWLREKARLMKSTRS